MFNAICVSTNHAGLCTSQTIDMQPLVTSKNHFFKRLFSSLAWRISSPFSSPSAAQPSLPVATLLSAAAGIAARQTIVQNAVNMVDMALNTTERKSGRQFG
jgi:hypothetical protein